MPRSFHNITAAFALIASPALGADLVVAVSGLESSEGRVACLLTGETSEHLLTVPAQAHSTFCIFEDVWPGTYVVTAFHDYNGNRVNDADHGGRAVEPFGTSSHNADEPFTMGVDGACILVTLNPISAQTQES